MQQIADWLEKLGMSEYVERFSENRIDFPSSGLGKSCGSRNFTPGFSDTPHTWVEWSCSQLLQNTPLHPIAEWGRQRFGGADVAGERRLAELESSLAQVKLDPAENASLLAPLLDIPLPKGRISTFAAEELRRRQLAALTNWVMAGGKVQPVVLAFEDLHWADPTTLDVLRDANGGKTRLQLSFRTGSPTDGVPFGVGQHLFGSYSENVWDVPLTRTTALGNRPDHLHIGRINLEVPWDTDRPGHFARCEPLAEGCAQSVTGIRQDAAKAHTSRNGAINLQQSQLRLGSCCSILGRDTRSIQPGPVARPTLGKKQPQRQHDRDFSSSIASNFIIIDGLRLSDLAITSPAPLWPAKLHWAWPTMVSIQFMNSANGPPVAAKSL